MNKKYHTIALLAALFALWALFLYQRSLQYGFVLHLEADLPYGMQSIEQLREHINRFLHGQKDKTQALTEFFKNSGQYHFIEVRCAHQHSCSVRADLSPVIGSWGADELLLAQPERLVKNIYSYQARLHFNSAKKLSDDIVILGNHLQAMLDGQADREQPLIVNIFADGTVHLPKSHRLPEIWAWPLESLYPKWQAFQQQFDQPLNSLESVDFRYFQGAVYTTEKKHKTKKP